MVHAELSVITYVPQEHSMAHWAIFLRVIDGDEIQNLIYQADGEEGELELNVREANPRASRRFSKEISLGEIDGERAIAEAKEALERQPMKNEISSWNCQDWVMESLETLNDESILDEYQYQDAKEKLEELYHN